MLNALLTRYADEGVAVIDEPAFLAGFSVAAAGEGGLGLRRVFWSGAPIEARQHRRGNADHRATIIIGTKISGTVTEARCDGPTDARAWPTKLRSQNGNPSTSISKSIGKSNAPSYPR